MRQSHLNKIRGNIEGGSIIRSDNIKDNILPNSLVEDSLTNKSKLLRLSGEEDPRVKRLKTELQKLDISPKTKYINFKIN